MSSHHTVDIMEDSKFNTTHIPTVVFMSLPVYLIPRQVLNIDDEVCALSALTQPM